MEKCCRKCKKTKDSSNFSKNKRKKDGFDTICKECDNERTQNYYKNNKEKVIKRTAEYTKNNPEIHKKAHKAWRQKNKEHLAQYMSDWQKQNIEYVKAEVKKWRKNNPDKQAAISGKARAARKQRVPKWLTKEQKNQILKFYKEARRLTKETGVAHHVDHIIPLVGKEVCGLHVPWNLQVLTAKENIIKNNKVIEV